MTVQHAKPSIDVSEPRAPGLTVSTMTFGRPKEGSKVSEAGKSDETKVARAGSSIVRVTECSHEINSNEANSDDAEAGHEKPEQEGPGSMFAKAKEEDNQDEEGLPPGSGGSHVQVA